MTDRELLEAAANAVNGGGWHPLTHDTPNGTWNPLADDGDALRLMTKLKMRIYTDRTMTVCARAHGVNGYTYELISGDLLIATRRAIVRAAAAMGEKA